VVTDLHGMLQYRYQAVTPTGVSVVKAAEGGLDEKSATGTILAHLDAATAIDSTGATVPTSHAYHDPTRSSSAQTPRAPGARCSSTRRGSAFRSPPASGWVPWSSRSGGCSPTAASLLIRWRGRCACGSACRSRRQHHRQGPHFVEDQTTAGGRSAQRAGVTGQRLHPHTLGHG
jgi:hypothetical protein